MTPEAKFPASTVSSPNAQNESLDPHGDRIVLWVGMICVVLVLASAMLRLAARFVS